MKYINQTILVLLVFIFLGVACKTTKQVQLQKTSAEITTKKEVPKKISIPDKNVGKAVNLQYEGEKHLKNIRQLTFGGDNAEAYFSFDNESLVLQRTNKEDGIECDQIYTGKIPKSANETFELQLVSTGKGRTTCSYFMPGDDKIVFASTHGEHESCPPVPERRQGDAYVWPLYPEFEIYVSDLEGNIKQQLTKNNYYDAEATVSPNLDKIVFTSTRNGDLDLYTCDIDGSNVQQVTFDLGYDGGAFFTPNGEQLIFRASRPKDGEEAESYQSFLQRNLVAPSDMELYICNLDGSGLRQITNLGNANWAPFMHPSGEKVVFSSNHKSDVGFPFHLYMINIDGTGLEQLTFDTKFDSFPMFSPDGKRFVWASNRNNGGTRDTNVFIADWVD